MSSSRVSGLGRGSCGEEKAVLIVLKLVDGFECAQVLIPHLSLLRPFLGMRVLAWRSYTFHISFAQESPPGGGLSKVCILM